METAIKGILGKKVAMTRVFSETGQSLPVTLIEVPVNVVTQVLTKSKHGYDAIQLAVFERRETTSTKPMIGHFKKAGLVKPQRYVHEIRGMKGHELGDKVSGTIFKPGELVDVTGTSKGHGFQGTIKRHGQHIGPKSHGGGGGSQPVRQTGSLGDMVSNRVFKGMTMPGRMGGTKITVQNLEVISFDDKLGVLLVKGAIPGPKKSFVTIRAAVKNLKSHTPVKLVDLKEALLMNKLLDEAKHLGIDINTDMGVAAMEAALAVARVARTSNQLVAELEEKLAKVEQEEASISEAAHTANKAFEDIKGTNEEAAIAEAEAKAKTIDHQLETTKAHAEKIRADLKAARTEAEAAHKKVESVEVKSDEPDAVGNDDKAAASSAKKEAK